MLFELAIGIGLTIVLIAFLAEYIDSTLGMGYGTTLTPILLLSGFEPIQVVPAILLSESLTGVFAGLMHHKVKNVDFKPRTMNPHTIFAATRRLGIAESFERGLPRHLKVALLIAFCSIFGSLFAVFVAVNIPAFYLKLYIGLLVLTIGIVILATMNKQYGFSWKKIVGLSLIASFNKGMSGGGYGPVVTGGQLLSGVEGKNAIGITSLAEGLTCIVAVIAYLYLNNTIDWVLAPYLVTGAVLSVPFAAISVKKIDTHKFKIIVGVATLVLGVATLWNVLM